jgi:hypothetical protein
MAEYWDEDLGDTNLDGKIATYDENEVDELVAEDEKRYRKRFGDYPESRRKRIRSRFVLVDKNGKVIKDYSKE